MINDDIRRHFKYLEDVHAKTDQLKTLIRAAKENEDVLLTPKQVTELLILIGELTLINAGKAEAAETKSQPF